MTTHMNIIGIGKSNIVPTGANIIDTAAAYAYHAAMQHQNHKRDNIIHQTETRGKTLER